MEVFVVVVHAVCAIVWTQPIGWIMVCAQENAIS